MAKISEIRQQIRFGLEQFKVRNGFHEFENLARDVARKRICKNILPATGPVGVGGDQGRDFETYKTFLPDTSVFAGVVGDKDIFFACSLEKQIVGKIRKDFRSIFKQTEERRPVYYFCVEDVPVSKRNALKRECLAQYGVDLEIIDGLALSEMLSDIDLFPIAAQYLNIPADIYPQPKKGAEWYQDYRERWLVRKLKASSMADFYEIKYAVRYATRKDVLHADLPGWIKILEGFVDEDTHLKRNAQYEICVASLRGLGNLDQQVNIVRDYFSNIETLETSADFEDATILLSYCSSAVAYNEFQIDANYLHLTSKQLVEKIERTVAAATGPNFRCALLECRARAALLQFLKSERVELDTDDLLLWWERLLQSVHAAPLFPLERFCDVISLVTPILGGDPRFIKITDRADELLSKRVGGFAAAEKARDRAVALFDSGNIIQAIEHLHRVKINWLAAETLRGGILATLFLSNCYSRLGLSYAAKYYALTAAFLAFHTDNTKVHSQISRSIFEVAKADYQAGNWIGFLRAVEIALLAHHNYDTDPLNFTEHKTLREVFYYVLGVKKAASKFWPQLTKHIVSKWSELAIDATTRQALEDIFSTEFEKSIFAADSLEVFWKESEAGLSGRPFGDVSPTRIISWKALGITWNIHFTNKYDLVCVAEEFASVLQIFLVDIARHDFGVLPMAVQINLDLSLTEAFNSEETSSNELITWDVRLPLAAAKSSAKFEDRSQGILGVVIAILAHCTTLPARTYFEKMGEITEQGLFSKVFYARPYPDVYSDIFSREDFDSFERNVTPFEQFRNFEQQEHENLSWNNRLGPGYSEEKALTHITNRYRRLEGLFKHLWPKFLANPRHLEFFRSLRVEGLKDWHIILIACNLAVNRYTSLIPKGDMDDAAYLKKLEATTLAIFKGEHHREIGEVDTDLIPETAMQAQKDILYFAILDTWKLVNHNRCPNVNAIKQYMIQRYKLFDLDVPHDDIPGLATA